MSLSDKPLLTQAQTRTRQRVAAHTGEALAGLGVVAIGARAGAGSLRAVASGKKIARPLSKVPGIRGMTTGSANKHADKLERSSNTLGTVGLGIGSAGALNSARLSYDASRRRSKPVAKTMDFGAHHDSGGTRIPETNGELVPIGKAFGEQRRNNAATTGLGAASAGSYGAARRKNNVGKSFESVISSARHPSPGQKRDRKVFGAGVAAGTAGAYLGRNTGKTKAGNLTFNTASARKGAGALKSFSHTRNGKAAGAAALAGIGAKVADNRMKSYKSSKGPANPYKPLYRG